MEGVPIQDWSLLIEVINQLRLDWNESQKKIEYKHTWDNFRLSLTPNTPTQILSLPEENNYEIIIYNDSEYSTNIYLGEDGGDYLAYNNSALFVYPKHGKSCECHGCTLWGISEKGGDIIITIHSDKPNPDKENMPIPLKIGLNVETGAHARRDTPLANLLAVNSDWHQIAYDTIQSNRGIIDGFKIARLKSYQPGYTYSMNVVLAENSDIDWDNTFNNPNPSFPLRIHLLYFDEVSFLKDTVIAIMRGLAYDALKEEVKKIMGQVKNKDTFIAGLSSTGGEFTITPGNFQNLLHFSVKTLSMGWQGAVITNFDKTTNTFTLGGY